ncbi:hypothetical protein [Atrimonas thermophila]|uniref:hypothetical protein n=1 Tax=Atrimonas thermophila TaxID=3064161 RepID=UPI00399C812F
MGAEGAVKSLYGSENNSIALTEQDFETSVVHPFLKVYVYKGGWQEVTDILSLRLDFKSSSIHGIVAASLDMEIDDSNRRYHPLSGTSYADYFVFRRKVKVYVGLKKDLDDDGIAETSYTWPYFIGYITDVRHEKTPSGRVVSVKALDYCDLLGNYKMGDMAYWGNSTMISLTGAVEYSLPTECTGVFKCFLDGEEFKDWTYNDETNVLAITKDGVTGNLTVHYFVRENIVDVLRDILLQAGVIASGSDLIYEDPGKYVDRVWFDEGTSAYDAITLITQITNFRFWFDGDGKPHFASVPALGVPVFGFNESKNIEAATIEISDKEFYNGVEVIGEERKREQYYRKEVVLGSVSGSLDAETVTREHSFVFANYGKLRYELNVGNANGLTSELEETSTGAKITVTHNPEYSHEDSEILLGQVSGQLGVLSNTEQKQVLSHVPATKRRLEIDESTNKYGLTTSLNPKDYWNTEISVSHDPLRNLSSVVQDIGSATGNASVNGSEIIVPYTPGKLFGNVKWNAEYDDGWGPEQLTGSGSWTLNWYETRYVTIWLNQDHQGQHRWEGTKPNPYPPEQIRVAGGVKEIPPNSYAYYTVYSKSKGKLTSWIAHGYVPNSGVTVSNPIIDDSGSYITVKFLVRNTTASTQYLYWDVYATTIPITFNITPIGAGDNYVRFKLSIEGDNGFSCPRSWPRTFTINVYSRRKPYNVKVAQTFENGQEARFIARCDFGTPQVTITCQGQEAIPRDYTIRVYGYKLIPRDYYLTLYGREIVSEKSEKVYAFKKLTTAEIQQTGGPKFLTIKNHLIQSQAEAESIAQSLLDHYRNVANVFKLTVTCPPPLEVGDTVSVIGTY